ncbi:MAG: Rid family detoxifying hydrolase [Flavobacterium sp.]|nr:Rid family detoxifying hydrolase [Flavobacterium sp.]
MKKIIKTKYAPTPIGPYNQAVQFGNTLFISGQIAINPETNELILDTIENETNQIMLNLKAILNAAEMTFENVVKTSIFLNDMHNFSKVNTVYGNYFNEETAPARETVQVSALPKFVNVEISMIAFK